MPNGLLDAKPNALPHQLTHQHPMNRQRILRPFWFVHRRTPKRPRLNRPRPTSSSGALIKNPGVPGLDTMCVIDTASSLGSSRELFFAETRRSDGRGLAGGVFSSTEWHGPKSDDAHRCHILSTTFASDDASLEGPRPTRMMEAVDGDGKCS